MLGEKEVWTLYPKRIDTSKLGMDEIPINGGAESDEVIAGTYASRAAMRTVITYLRAD
jgi:hypothetical protein